MEKIFVSAYACEPGMGSEIGVGWHWVLEMSKYFELWVLTRENNRHTIESWTNNHPNNKIHFLFYDLPKWARFWKKGLRGVRIYYYLWQLCTNSIVKQTMRTNNIRLYHLLTYGNALWPASSYGQKQFFVWGPVSVGVSLPKDFTKHYTFFSRQKEAIQRVTTKFLPWNFGFIKRCKNANIILCKTDETITHIPERYRDKCVQFTDVAVEEIDYNMKPMKTKIDKVTYLTAGSLVGWRNIDVLIESFKLAYDQLENIHLIIIGDGNEAKRLKRIIKTLEMGEHIEMLGQLNRSDYFQQMAIADVIINPCLREGGVTVSFDSMSFSKPLICFETGGYTHSFSHDYCRIIQSVKTRAEAVEKLSTEIVFMARANRKAMGEKAYEVGKKLSWEHKGRLFFELISSYYPVQKSNE